MREPLYLFPCAFHKSQDYKTEAPGKHGPVQYCRSLRGFHEFTFEFGTGGHFDLLAPEHAESFSRNVANVYPQLDTSKLAK